MIIKAKGYLTFKDTIGQREFEFPDNMQLSLIDFLEFLASELDSEIGEIIYNRETSTVGQFVAVMCNGRHYNHLPDKLSTILQPDDEIAIFPPAAGG